MTKIILNIFTLSILTISAYAQKVITANQPTSADARWQGYEQRKSLINNSLVSNISFRAIGPSIQSCRVTDVDVNPNDPSQFYVAYASGGLWETTNNGTTFSPKFDNEAVMTIGDIAVNWDKKVIWLGSGEVNSSRSSYAGAGIFKSADNGKSWQYAGLGESHHIGRIILHPTNPDIVYVAVLGHLYSPNKERGVFKTADGGKTWQHVLALDENTGAVDMIIDSQSPDNLYVTTWQRERRAWNFVESGTNSGIYKTNNAGTTWTKLNTANSGFPSNKGTGRIGLAMHQKGNQKVLFAVIDNQEAKPLKDQKEEDKEVLSKKILKVMSREDFLKIEESKLADFLKNNDFPDKVVAKDILTKVKEGKMQHSILVDYLEDANSRMMETEIKGAELYRSDDEGVTWKKTHEGYLDGLFFTYGYYFATVAVSPTDANQIYIMGMPIVRSDDGGKTFKYIGADNVHADHHYLWINPQRPNHIINGNDGGINISYDAGASWIKCNNPPVGQIYHLAVDMAKPYNVYAGFQDNGVWKGSSTSKWDNVEWLQDGQNSFKMIMGGDGMQTAIDTRDNQTIYTGWQFGNYYRLNLKSDENKSITPKHELQERPYRWNWQSPIALSTHNQDIVYMGANKVFRSMDKGEHFEAISDDLTDGGKIGNVPFGTLTTLHESPLKFGLIYTGSDDGKINVTKDGGNTWTNLNFGLPEGLYVSRIQASAFAKSRVYVSLNGYRQDDFGSYLFISENYGTTWKKIGTTLPAEPINVVKEDTKNENIIYVGTDHGVYVSWDKGLTFSIFQKDLPAVPVHDLVIHPRESELVLGTHGRSILIASVKEIQQITPEILASSLHIFDIKKAKARNWGNSWNKFIKAEEPNLAIPIYSNNGGKAKINIFTEKDILLYSFDTELNKGFNYPTYHYEVNENALTSYEKALNDTAKEKDAKAKSIKVKKADNGKHYLKASKYKVVIEKEGKNTESKFEIE